MYIRILACVATASLLGCQSGNQQTGSSSPKQNVPIPDSRLENSDQKISMKLSDVIVGDRASDQPAIRFTQEFSIRGSTYQNGQEYRFSSGEYFNLKGEKIDPSSPSCSVLGHGTISGLVSNPTLIEPNTQVSIKKKYFDVERRFSKYSDLYPRTVFLLTGNKYQTLSDVLNAGGATSYGEDSQIVGIMCATGKKDAEKDLSLEDIREAFGPKVLEIVLSETQFQK